VTDAYEEERFRQEERQAGGPGHSPDDRPGKLRDPRADPLRSAQVLGEGPPEDPGGPGSREPEARILISYERTLIECKDVNYNAAKNVYRGLGWE